MITLGPDEMARYPFLAESGAYLRDAGFTLEQFGTDPDLRRLLDGAEERVMAAARGEARRAGGAGALSGDAATFEVFSFLLAVVLLRMAGRPSLVRRFALREAMEAERRLEQDLRHIVPGRDAASAAGGRRRSGEKELAARIVGSLTGVRIVASGDDAASGATFAVPVADYVERSGRFHEREWKLVNRGVSAGLVRLTAHEAIRLVRAELGNHISSSILSAKAPPVPPGLEGPVGRLSAYADRHFPRPVAPKDAADPPCVKHAAAVLERGENLPHSGRFLLATFLLRRGRSVEQIAPLFRNAPDYSERVTMYQLNNLATKDGTGYSCPSCDKVRGQGLCFATPECDGIVNPVQFGTRAAAPPGGG